jgi:hypothetical protein
MSDLKPLYLLFLWRLATSGGSVWNKDVLPASVVGKDRKIIKALGLIEEAHEKDPTKPKSKALLKIYLTEAGWGYLANHLTDPINTRSPATAIIFGQFLGHLSRFLKSRSLNLAEIFLTAIATPTAIESLTLAEALVVVQERLEAIRAEKYRPSAGLRLAELRPQLPNVPARLLDQAIIELQKRRYLDLSDLGDDPSQLTELDKNAAIVVAGRQRHLLYLK